MDSQTLNKPLDGHSDYQIKETFEAKDELIKEIKDEVPLKSPVHLESPVHLDSEQKRPNLDSTPPKDENESKTEESKQSIGSKVNAGFVAIKEFGANLFSKSNERLKMEGILNQSLISLKAFLDPELSFEKQIPIKLLAKCKGIVFLSIVKAGFGVGGAIGTGCLIKHNAKNNDWSYPIALGSGGLNVGFQVGVSKIDMIMVLTTENAVKSFTQSGQLKLGGDVGVSVGPKGRNGDASLIGNTKNQTAIYSYSLAKGAYVGITLNGEVILARMDCNNEFYGVKATCAQILEGKVTMPQNSDWNDICKILTEYTKQKL